MITYTKKNLPTHFPKTFNKHRKLHSCYINRNGVRDSLTTVLTLIFDNDRDISFKALIIPYSDITYNNMRLSVLLGKNTSCEDYNNLLIRPIHVEHHKKYTLALYNTPEHTLRKWSAQPSLSTFDRHLAILQLLNLFSHLDHKNLVFPGDIYVNEIGFISMLDNINSKDFVKSSDLYFNHFSGLFEDELSTTYLNSSIEPYIYPPERVLVEHRKSKQLTESLKTRSFEESLVFSVACLIIEIFEPSVCLFNLTEIIEFQTRLQLNDNTVYSYVHDFGSKIDLIFSNTSSIESMADTKEGMDFLVLLKSCFCSDLDKRPKIQSLFKTFRDYINSLAPENEPGSAFEKCLSTKLVYGLSRLSKHSEQLHNGTKKATKELNADAKDSVINDNNIDKFFGFIKSLFRSEISIKIKRNVFLQFKHNKSKYNKIPEIFKFCYNLAKAFDYKLSSLINKDGLTKIEIAKICSLLYVELQLCLLNKNSAETKKVIIDLSEYLNSKHYSLLNFILECIKVCLISLPNGRTDSLHNYVMEVTMEKMSEIITKIERKAISIRSSTEREKQLKIANLLKEYIANFVLILFNKAGSKDVVDKGFMFFEEFILKLDICKANFNIIYTLKPLLVKKDHTLLNLKNFLLSQAHKIRRSVFDEVLVLLDKTELIKDNDFMDSFIEEIKKKCVHDGKWRTNYAKLLNFAYKKRFREIERIDMIIRIRNFMKELAFANIDKETKMEIKDILEDIDTDDYLLSVKPFVDYND